MPMKRENGRVLIDISEDQFGSLLLCLGYAIGAAASDGKATKTANNWLRLTNAINEGNPHYTPYKVSDDAS